MFVGDVCEYQTTTALPLALIAARGSIVSVVVTVATGDQTPSWKMLAQSSLSGPHKDGELQLDFDDEVVKGACVVRAGEAVA